MGEIAVIDAENDKVIQNSSLCKAGEASRGLALKPFWWFPQ